MDNENLDKSGIQDYLMELNEIEARWLEIGASAIADVVRAHPGERFYSRSYFSLGMIWELYSPSHQGLNV